MYAEHVPIIRDAIRQDKRLFKRAVMFALISARTQFIRVPTAMRDLAKHKDKSGHLWGWKYDAYMDVEEHGDKLWSLTGIPNNVWKPNKENTTQTLLYLCRRIRGLGVVKGAFVLQMLGYDIACLDTVNIQREGRNPRAYRSDGDGRKQTKAFGAKVERYVNDTWGQAERYWNEWCEAQAIKYQLTASEISAMHVDAIVPKNMQRKSEIPF